MSFSLPASYYEQPEATEMVLDIDTDELECGEFGEFDASSYDGEEWTLWCDKCEASHNVVREAPEPDYEAMMEDRREAYDYDY